MTSFLLKVLWKERFGYGYSGSSSNTENIGDRITHSKRLQRSDKTQTPAPTAKNSDCDTCKWYEARAFRCLIGAGIDCEYEVTEKVKTE